MRNFFLMLTIALTAGAQTSQLNNQKSTTTEPPTPANGSISGTVLDAGSSTPLAEVRVLASNGKTRDPVTVDTDPLGRYVLRGLPAGKYTVCVFTQEGAPLGFKTVTLSSGQQMTSVDFQIEASGEILGHVVDEDRRPLPGMTVFLVAQEYAYGSLRYSMTNMARTEERGEYRITDVHPARVYFVLAKRPLQILRAISDAPDDLELRKRVLTPTYYSGSQSIDGAQAVVLRSHEQREALDIHVSSSASFCMEGVLEYDGHPSELRFEITEQEPNVEAVSTAGVFPRSPYGVSGPDGRFRVCDLHPGEYKLTATDNSASELRLLGTALVKISDRDVSGVHISPRGQLAVPVEVTCYAMPSGRPAESTISIELEPLTWLPSMKSRESKRLRAESSIPGHASLREVLMDDYYVQARLRSPSLYIKEVKYGNENILHGVLHLGSAIGNSPLGIVVAGDGGFVSAVAADSDGNPIPGAHVIIAPDTFPTEAVLADSIVEGQTDQRGTYLSGPLAPGRYYVFSTSKAINLSPEDMSKILRLRSRSEAVDVQPNNTINVRLTTSSE